MMQKKTILDLSLKELSERASKASREAVQCMLDNGFYIFDENDFVIGSVDIEGDCIRRVVITPTEDYRILVEQAAQEVSINPLLPVDECQRLEWYFIAKRLKRFPQIINPLREAINGLIGVETAPIQDPYQQWLQLIDEELFKGRFERLYDSSE